MKQKNNIVIIGAGISGLSSGYHLKKKLKGKANLIVLEQKKTPGGWVKTSHENACLFEMGPRSFRTKGRGANTLALIEELNLTSKVLVPSASAKKRYLFWNKTLYLMPSGLTSFLTNPLTRKLIPGIIKEPFVKKNTEDDETIYDFFRRRFNTPCAQIFADALVTGIFSGDPKKLSIRSCFPHLWQAEQNAGSVIRNALTSKKKNVKKSEFVTSMQKFSMLTFKGGMQTLTDQLASKLSENLKVSCEIKNIQFKNDVAEVFTTNGDSYIADAIIFTVPPKPLANMTEAALPSLSQLAKTIDLSTVVVVGMQWRKKVFQQEGFGYLIPHLERANILGTVFDSSAFPEQNTNSNEQRISVMMGGTRHKEITKLKDSEIFKIAWESVKEHLHISIRPTSTIIHKAIDAIPQYSLNHHKVVSDMQELVNKAPIPIALAGSYLEGVSLNDCIYQGKNAADQIIEKLYNV